MMHKIEKDIETGIIEDKPTSKCELFNQCIEGMFACIVVCTMIIGTFILGIILLYGFYVILISFLNYLNNNILY